MADKGLGLGGTVSVDAAGGSSFTVVALTISITHPDRMRFKVDGTVLADTLSTYEMGIEEHSTFEYTQFWDPTDTNHIIMETLFGNKAIANWKITYAFATPITSIFLGQVSGLSVPSLDREGLLTRVVTINRTAAITNA